MARRIVTGIIFLISTVVTAHAQCSSYPHALTNGTTADATQVMDNFNCAALTLGATLTSANLVGTTTFPLGAFTPAGNVGVGTTTPLNNAGQTSLTINGTSFSRLDLWTGGSSDATFYADSSSANLGTNIATPLYFYTNGAANTAMTILSGGNVGIATTSPSYTLHVNGSVAGTSAYNNLSDERLKKDIVPIRDALAIIEGLRGVRFNWRKPEQRPIGKELNLPVGEPQVGFVAQEVRKVLPEAVTVSAGREAVMSVEESKVGPVLVEAVKELEAANDELKAANYKQSRDFAQRIAQLKTANDYQAVEIGKLKVEVNDAQAVEIRRLEAQVSALENARVRTAQR